MRHSWITKPDRETAGFIDAAAFEEERKKGVAAIKNWINEQLDGTSVTVVLIGAEPSDRDYINYEIRQGYMKNNGCWELIFII